MRTLMWALGLASALLPRVAAMHVTISSRASECFYVEGESYKHGISLTFEVLRGVADELETELRDGKDQVVYTHKGTVGRFVSPIGHGGMHSVCFKNDRPSVGDVIIGFSFHADDPNHEVLSNADATKIKHVVGLEDLVYDLSVNLDTVKDSQAYMKALTNYQDQRTFKVSSSACTSSINEVGDKSLKMTANLTQCTLMCFVVITSTQNQIMWWTLAEMVVLTAVSIAQISYLRRTLEVRRIL